MPRPNRHRVGTNDVLFGYNIRSMLSNVATLREKIAAEHKVRELLAKENVPEPDRIEYGHTCIRLLWTDSKVVLVVDIDEFANDQDQSLINLDVFPREQ